MASAEPRAPGGGAAPWDARVWGALLVLCSAIFLDGLDVSMVNVALPSIRDNLGLETGDLQWIVSGYMLGLGGFLLLGGRAADLFGRRRVLLLALGVFAVASALGGLSSDGTVLIATRFAKGVSAAFTIPAALSLVTTTFPAGRQRNRALGIYAACGASGFSMGLIAGGLLTEIGWRWTFLAPGPAALAILLAALLLIRPDGAVATDRRGFDAAGAIAVSGGMLVLVRTVVTAPEAGWGSAATLGGFALAAALLAGFVVIELRTAQPLVRLGILRSTPLVRANVGAVAMNGSFTAFQFVATLYVQTLLGWSPLETALGFLPVGLAVALGAPRVGRLVDRIGTTPVVAAGFASFVAGYALFLRIDASSSYAGTILPTMVLVGVGVALTFPALNMQATSDVADEEQGLASGLINTSLQVGGAVVLSVVAAVIAGRATGAASLLDAYRPGIALVAALSACGLALMLSGVSRPPWVRARRPGTGS